jgi:glutaredoxin
MEVVVYTRPGDDQSRRIKELLEEKGVEFQEHICVDGRIDGRDRSLPEVNPAEIPLTVIDGVPIAGLNRSLIEQAIGWHGF